MKKMKNLSLNFKPLLLLAVVSFFCSCSDEEKPNEVKETVVQGPKNPFPFYKSIEVKPGQTFEILSWGKGVDSIGGYQILMSDSSKNSFKSVAAERNGILNDAWNMDLDTDGNPEFYMQLLSKKNVLDLNVYEYAGGSFNKISFPSLSSNQKKGYAGGDKFFIKNGDLFRSYPVKDERDSTKNILKTIQYRLSGNNFSTSEVKP